MVDYTVECTVDWSIYVVDCTVDYTADCCVFVVHYMVDCLIDRCVVSRTDYDFSSMIVHRSKQLRQCTVLTSTHNKGDDLQIKVDLWDGSERWSEWLTKYLWVHVSKHLINSWVTKHWGIDPVILNFKFLVEQSQMLIKQVSVLGPKEWNEI